METTPAQSSFSKTALVVALLCGILAAFAVFTFLKPSSGPQEPLKLSGMFPTSGGTAEVPFENTPVVIAPGLSGDFALAEVKNIADMEKAYGIVFTKEDLARLAEDKFIVKNILDTNVAPVSVGENGREFVSLYGSVTGYSDYKTRTPANAVYISPDVLMNLFSILSVDLLKEAENSYLSSQVKGISEALYLETSRRLAAASNDSEKEKWRKLRNYFVVPYALLSTAVKPLTAEDYWSSGRSESVSEMKAEYDAKDATADTEESVRTFVQALALDPASEKAVLQDIGTIYTAEGKGLPEIFAEEYATALRNGISFKISLASFKVRGSYTSSSLRRQYFRAVQWYQQVPFFVGSESLSGYALSIGEILGKYPELLAAHDSMSSLIDALIGASDDLDARDYAAAVRSLGADPSQEMLATFLDERKPQARIKSLPAFYPTVGDVSRDEVIRATRGMRFFSQKFIPDSYWTGKLSQGDEEPDVQGMKLPRSVSSLEVMSILGSYYAQSALPLLPFYSEHKAAIDTRLEELSAEAASWGGEYWQKNPTTATLWTIAGLFGWSQENRALLPRYMQSPRWEMKQLMTGSAFWTELRHTNILYAKQSFAEKGGGGDGECDTREIPAPPMGYVEPNLEAYDRLSYTARLLEATYASRGFELKNLPKLGEFIELVDIVREYAKLELENTAFEEPVITKNVPAYNDPECMQKFIDPSASIVRGADNLAWNADQKPVAALSRAEELRFALVARMRSVLPTPVEGPIVPMKDKRTALVADIHGSDEGFVEEGIGPPRIIFVAVKDANGPRLTVGFIYSHYESLVPSPLTDEAWQSRFYEGGSAKDYTDEYRILYMPKSAWPEPPLWYRDLLQGK